MSRITKLILFIATIYPGLYFIWANINNYKIMGSSSSGEQEFFRFFALNAFTMILILALLIFYMIHLYRNPRIHGNNKMIWTIALFLGSFGVMPIYWWRHIWPSKERIRKPKPN